MPRIPPFHILSALVVAALGICASIGSFVACQAWGALTVELQFRPGAIHLEEAIRTRLDAALSDLRAVNAFFGGGEERAVSGPEFTRLARALDGEAGVVRWLAWAPRVAAPRYAALEVPRRFEAPESFASTEDATSDQRRAAADRYDHFPIAYIEPPADDGLRPGVDLASVPMLRSTLDRASETGVAVASGPFEFRNGREVQRALFVVMPQFGTGPIRAANESPGGDLAGFSVAVIRFDDLADAVTARVPEMNRQLLLRDASVLGDAGILYDSNAVETDRQTPPPFTLPASERLRHQAFMDFAGRRLEITVTPIADVGAGAARISPISLLIFGLVMTLALALKALRSGGGGGSTVAADSGEDVQDAPAARRATRDYGLIFNALPIPITLIDPSRGVIVDANAEACRYFAGSGERLSELPVSDLYRMPPGTLAATLDQVAEGRCHRFCAQSRRRGGDLRDVEVHASPVGARGRDLILTVTHDVTERCEVEDSLRRSEAFAEELVQRIPVGVYVFRFHPRSTKQLEYVSPRFCELVQADAQRLLADFQQALALAHPDDRAGLTRAVDAACASLQAFKWEGRVIVGDRTRWLHIVANPRLLADGGGLWSGVVLDVTERRELELALLRSREETELALDASGAGLWDWHVRSGTLSLDERWARLGGYRLEELQPIDVRTWLNLSHPDDRVSIRSLLKRHLRGETVCCDHEFRMRHKAGHWLWVLDRGRVVERDAAGKPLRAVGTRIDITARKRSEEELARYRSNLEEVIAARTSDLAASEARFRGIVEQSMAGIYIVENGIVRYANQGVAEVFGLPSPEGIADRMSLLDFVVPEERAAVAAQIRRQVDGEAESLRYTFTGMRVDGRRVAVEAYGRRLQQGGCVKVIGILLDITERNAAEAARQAALEAAEQLTRLKSEFLSNTSHELRTPLNGILGMAAAGLRAGDLPKAHQALERVLECGRQLLGLVENVLDFSDLDAGSLHLAPGRFDPAESLARMAERAQAKCQAKGLAFQLDIAPGLPQVCVGDEHRIGQVLWQLLENAIKFTECGSVTLAAARTGPWLVLHVDDTGVGMTTEQIERLFHPFEQADGSATRRYGGVGLGLALTGLLVERLGGTLQVRSAPGQGSSFEVRLPLLPALPEVSATPSEDPQDPQGRLAGVSVLLVDDFEATRAFVANVLEREGAVVDVAVDGHAALQKLGPRHASGYDIALTGIPMADMDGYELARQLHRRLPTMPVVALLPDPPREADSSRCEAAGIDGRLVAPVDADAVVRCVRKCLGSPGAGVSPPRDPM